MSEELISVRLVVADNGAFRDLTVWLPRTAVNRHERLIDAIREDPAITANIFVDRRRLVAAWILAGDDATNGTGK